MITSIMSGSSGKVILLLFSDPKMVDAHRTEKFRDQASHVTHQQHLQMGLRKGMTILIAESFCGTALYRATMPSRFLIWDWKPNGLMRI